MDKALFVQNVKKQCQIKGVTLTEACRESGAGEKLIRNIQTGSIPSVERVQLLADYFGITTSDLLGEKKESDATMGVELSEAELALISLFRQLPSDQQDTVIRIVQAATGK